MWSTQVVLKNLKDGKVLMYRPKTTVMIILNLLNGLKLSCRFLDKILLLVLTLYP